MKPKHEAEQQDSPQKLNLQINKLAF